MIAWCLTSSLIRLISTYHLIENTQILHEYDYKVICIFNTGNITLLCPKCSTVSRSRTDTGPICQLPPEPLQVPHLFDIDNQYIVRINFTRAVSCFNRTGRLASPPSRVCRYPAGLLTAILVSNSPYI